MSKFIHKPIKLNHKSIKSQLVYAQDNGPLTVKQMALIKKHSSATKTLTDLFTQRLF